MTVSVSGAPDTFGIDTSALQNGLQQFDSKKAVFEKTAYSTYKGSYLKTSGSSTVAKLRAKVDGLYSDLSSSYSGISSYTEAYLQSMLNLEASLKNGNITGADAVNVISRINRLNAILNGGDPSELEIDPRTGMVKEGIFGIPGSYKALNMKEFEKANAAKKLTYIDENGKKVTIDGYTANEMNMVITAAMTNNTGYYNMVVNGNKQLSKKNAAILTYEYVTMPILFGHIDGFMESSMYDLTHPLGINLYNVSKNKKFTTTEMGNIKFTKKQKETIYSAKCSKKYVGGYASGFIVETALSFYFGGKVASAVGQLSSYGDLGKFSKFGTSANSNVLKKLGKVESVVSNKVSSILPDNSTKKIVKFLYTNGKKYSKNVGKRLTKNAKSNLTRSLNENYDSDSDNSIFNGDMEKNLAKKTIRGSLYNKKVSRAVGTVEKVRKIEATDAGNKKLSSDSTADTDSGKQLVVDALTGTKYE